jgi:serine/threonine protein kinase
MEIDTPFEEPPKRKFGFVFEQAPEAFQAEINKSSSKKTSPIKYGKQEKSRSRSRSRSPRSSSRSSSQRSRSTSVEKRQTKRPKAELRLPGMATTGTTIKTEKKTVTKKPTKAPVRRVTSKKKNAPVLFIPSQRIQGQKYVMGEDIELQPNDQRSETLTFRIMNTLGAGAYGDVYQVYPISQVLPEYFPKSKDGVTTYALKVTKIPIRPSNMTKSEEVKYNQKIKNNLESYVFENKIMNNIAQKFKDQPGKCPEHVSCYFDVSQDKDGMYYMLSERMDGNLRNYIKNLKNPTQNSLLNLALRVFHQTLDGLADLKKIGLLHRDLKEENLLYKIPSPNGRPRPSDIQIKIGDFGLSCIPGRTADLECQGVAGTIPYIDPKLLVRLNTRTLKTDEFTDKNDMYSLAVILYNIIFGSYLNDNDWAIINPYGARLNSLDPLNIRQGYEDLYNERVEPLNELIEKFEKTRSDQNQGILKMLLFIKQNLIPFDWDKRTSVLQTLTNYTI